MLFAVRLEATKHTTTAAGPSPGDIRLLGPGSFSHPHSPQNTQRRRVRSSLVLFCFCSVIFALFALFLNGRASYKNLPCDSNDKIKFRRPSPTTDSPVRGPCPCPCTARADRRPPALPSFPPRQRRVRSVLSLRCVRAAARRAVLSPSYYLFGTVRAPSRPVR